ncbi:MAG: hypothetical protein NTW08_08925 [Gammaproteobacteria bacterium]|nr:hypothetical protein [Gammaproteobacteria bacterium]
MMGRLFTFFLALIMTGAAHAEPLSFPIQKEFDWVFSGMVLNERGERYGYYFEIQRQKEQFRVLSTLVNVEKKTLVFVEENEATIHDASTMNWQVGKAYLGFNPVTNRWGLGVATKMHQGFNFKIDALPMESVPHSKQLRTGLEMVVNQMGRLNGHLQIAKENEEFVTAKNTWFRQVISMHASIETHPMTHVLCHFNDGSGFYAAHLLDPTALQGFVAGWRSSDGLPMKMSQFVNIQHPSLQDWQVSASVPAFHLHFSNLLDHAMKLSDMGAGVVDGAFPGFCVAEKKRV